MTDIVHTLHQLLHCANVVEDYLRQRLVQVGVPHRQALIVDGISRMEPVSQVRLAREFRVTPASMSTMTVRLIDAGYVSREPDPKDVRGNLLCLTPVGRSLLADIHAAWGDVDAAIQEKIGPQNAAVLADLTVTLRRGFGGRVPGTVIDEPENKG